jgi:hypothetical protein
MYSSCLFCHVDLGQNEAIETFPLGRRLAFDAARGRLWVVCAECKGWNLTPLDERWEAVEECERRYQDARLRVSTGQISLARLRDGLDLVRIGEPARPEFAAWRYGERLALRRRNSLIRLGLGAGVFGAVVVGGAAIGATVGIAAMWLSAAATKLTRASPDKILAFIPWRTRSRLVVRRKHLEEARLLTKGEGYRISVPGHTMELSDDWAADLSGRAAINAASRLLPEVNRFGGSRRSIAAATSLLARWPEPEALYAMVAANGEAKVGTPFGDLPVEMRLALEMAAHEDTERRALEGELQELMSAWRDADEIARISDAMFQPVEIGDWLARAKAQGT